jgi:DUF4097 and DUF4098 domain-containing protein YvlB
MGAVTASGPGKGSRLLWRASGVVTVAFLAAAVSASVVRLGTPGPTTVSAVPTRVVTITQPVTSVNVQSYGAPIEVTRGSGPDVTVAEAVGDSDGAPAVTAAVSNGQLTLAAPSCESSGCNVGFTVTLPAAAAVTAVSSGGNIIVNGVTGASLDSGGGNVWATGVTGSLVVSSEGGAVIVSGSTGANIDSGGGPVRATSIHGPLTVSSENGAVSLAGLTGTLYADTGGGPLFATGVSAPTATVVTESGDVRLAFVTAPNSVQVNTGGGAAFLSVPGGPYALTTDNGGGPQSVGISINPAAARSINVATQGGALQVEPARTSGSSGSLSAQPGVTVPKVPVPPPVPTGMK